MTDLVRQQGNVLASAQIMGEEEFDRVWRMAKALASSGMFKDVTQAEQAFGRILLGADLGLTPTRALMTIDVVRGNVQIRGKLLLAWVKQSEQYDYDVIERTPETGTLRFFEKSKRTGEWTACEPDITFTLKQAEEKGLVKKDGGWDKWPENMCLWRCASIGVNLFCPDLTNGVPVYTEADSFDSTAVEIAAGEGDGSEPGWDGPSDEQVKDVEALLEVAATFGHPLDKASVQLRLNGQPPEYVENWLGDTRDMLAKRTEGEQPTLAPEDVPGPGLGS